MKIHISFLKPEHSFLCIAVTFGILLVFITPPFQTPDEHQHFYRAFQISELKMVAEKQGSKVGGFLPENLRITALKTMGDVRWNPEKRVNPNKIFPFFKLPLKPENRIFMEFPAIARYSPVAYIPQAVGITIGKLLKSPPLILHYIGRFFNLAVWILLLYLAIKITPVSKWLFLLLALTPMSIFLSASLSADVLTNGLSFLLIAVCLQHAFEENKIIRPVDIFILFLLSVLLSLTKQIYFFIPVIFLLIPVRKIGGKTKYFLIFAGMMLLCISAVMCWFLIVKDIIVPLKPDIFANEQILFILTNPLKFLEVAIKTLSSKKYISHFIGRLGWMDTELSWFFVLPYFLTLLSVALLDVKEKITIHLNQKIIILTTLLLNVLLICASQYITWTPVGRPRIQGIFGRYFIPVAPLLFLLFYGWNWGRSSISSISITKDRTKIFIICFSMLSLTYTIIVLIRRYYLI